MSKNCLPYYKAFPRDFMEGTVGMKAPLCQGSCHRW